jgi:hypothetical protein
MATIAYVLGKAQGEMIKGAIAVAILGVALIPFAFAMSLIAGLDIGSVIAAAAGLVIFSAAVFGLGALMSTGVGAFIFGAGLIALAGLGLSMMVLGAGLLVAGAGFEKIGGSMGGMLGLADAFPLLAVGIGSLAIAAALGGGKVTSFIQGIAEGASLLAGGAAQGLQTTAQAMMSMGSGLAMINDQLDRLNPEKLEALSNFSMSLSIGGVMTAVGEAVGGLVDSVSAVIGGGEGGSESLSQYETDALRYLERIAAATEKGATIKGRDRSAFNPMGISNN